MALALYRKYRPRTFAEVIGQEHVTEPLMQALRTGRLNHAYLFSGPRGCGKTSSARILARSLNCEKGPTPEPCGVCDSCVALAPDGAGSLDVIEIDAASHGGVDDARDLRERAFFAPVASRFKVYIIDEAHMISSQGFNALLKLVEEPPEYIKFVFATTEPEKVLGTIRSRTHHYPFRLIPPGVLRPYLETLCEQEGVSVESTVFPLVVRAGGGSARDSLSVLDQLISGAGPGGVRYRDAVSLLGVTDVALIDEVCDGLAAADGAAVFATIDRVAEAGHDPRRFAGDLLERLRDLIVLQQVPDAVGKGIIDAPGDDLSRMEQQAQRFGTATLSRMADIVHTGLTEMRGTTAPRLLLELICARMLLPAADDSTSALLQRLERMERRLTATGDPLPPTLAPAAAGPARPAPAAAPAPPASPPPASPLPVEQAERAPARPAPAAAPPVVEAPVVAAAPVVEEPAPAAGPPGVVDAAAVRRVWDEVLGYLRRRKPRTAALAREAVVRDVQGDTLILTFRHQFHADQLTADPSLLEEAVYEVLGGRWRIRAEWLGGDAGTAPAPASGDRATGGSPGGRTAPRSGGPSSAGRAAPEGRAPSGGQASPAAQAPSAGQAQSPGPAASAGRAPSAGPAQSAGRAPGQPSGPVAVDNEEWPETARPGGDAVAAAEALARTPAAPGGAVAVAPAAPVAAPERPRAPQRGTRPEAETGSTGTATRGRGSSAATRRPGTQARGGTRRPGNSDTAWRDAPPADEPPFDPDYDRPVRDQFEGFDPGDEPLDDVVDAATARESSEEQALRLLRETLGAERID